MIRLFCCCTLLLASAACEGIASLPGDGGASSNDGGTNRDAGQPIVLTHFTLRADNWPVGKALVGAALVDNVLFAATSTGVRSLAATSTTWQTVTTPLQAGEAPTSLQRFDTTLVLTFASSSGGGVLIKPYDVPTWSKVSAAPNQPTWQLVKKGSQFFLATSAGLFTATDVNGPWVQRSAVGTALFTHPVPFFVAATQQARLFAAGDPASSLGTLATSDDDGVTWSTGLATGVVRALAASGPQVFVQATAQLWSDNYGSTLKPMQAPVGAPVNVFVVNQGRVWAGTSTGLRTSDDSGRTWVDDVNGLPANTSVTALVITGSVLLVDSPAGPYLTQFQ